MKMIYKLKPIVLGLISFLYINNSLTLPYQFRRIVFYKGNTVIKTIDLISDEHTATDQFVKNPSRWRRKYLKPGENAGTTVERTLLIALRKMAEKKESVEVLWEISRLVTNELYIPSSLAELPGGYIAYGAALQKEFGDAFKNIDTYRFNEGNISRYLLTKTNLTSEEESLLLRNVIAFIPQLLDSTKNKDGSYTSKAFADLEAVNKTKEFNRYYEPLNDYWNKFTQRYVQPVADYFKQFLDKNPDITVGEFRKQVGVLPDNIGNKINTIPDAEFIIKSFTSDSPHIIIYGGGYHCDAVAKLLLKRVFEGEKVIDLGIDSFLINSLRVPIHVFLIPDTWIYLEENPQKSLMRYKSHQKKPLNIYAGDVLDEFVKLYQEITSLSKSGSPDIDEKITKRIEAFYKKSSKTYIDFLNSFDDSGKTILHWAVMANLPKATAYLVKHGARVLVADNDGKTPLDYAHSEEMKKILQHK